MLHAVSADKLRGCFGDPLCKESCQQGKSIKSKNDCFQYVSDSYSREVVEHWYTFSCIRDAVEVYCS